MDGEVIVLKLCIVEGVGKEWLGDVASADCEFYIACTFRVQHYVDVLCLVEPDWKVVVEG